MKGKTLQGLVRDLTLPYIANWFYCETSFLDQDNPGQPPCITNGKGIIAHSCKKFHLKPLVEKLHFLACEYKKSFEVTSMDYYINHLTARTIRSLAYNLYPQPKISDKPITVQFKHHFFH